MTALYASEPQRIAKWSTAIAGITTMAAAALTPYPAALALDLDGQGDLITDTIANQDRRQVWDDAGKHGALPVSEIDRGFAQPEGIRLGNFVLFPSVSETAVYDDNIFARPSDIEPDFKFITQAALVLQSRLPRHVLDATITGRLINYAENTDQDYADYGALVRGALQIDHAHTLSAAVNTSLDYEERGAATAPLAASEPIPIHRNRLSVGLTRDAGRLYGTLSATAETLDYSDVRALDGSLLDQDNRDQTIYAGQLRTGYRFSPGFELVSKARIVRNLNEIDDAADADRHSTGYEGLVGVAFEQGALVSWRLMGGWGHREFDSALYPSVDSSLLDAEVRWLATERLTIYGNASRALVDEVGATDNGRVDTTLGARAEFEIRHDLVANLRAEYIASDFTGSNRTDDTIELGAELDWYMHKNWLFSIGYVYEDRDSTDDNFDYSRNQVRIGGKLKF
ncbi:MAG: outer membrane beta-barrel protein [Hyphomicrobium sp.]|nr:outer membrane beta-barrel protein [Hyphomicrobium sp.]